MKSIGVGLFVLSTGLVACSSSSSSKPFTACTIGSLTGTWRVTYVETNGTCGKVADETVVLSATTTPGAPGMPTCMIAAADISADHCRIDLDFTCPLNGAPGSQRWIGATHQVSATELTSSLTLTVTSPTLGACRSTYAVDWTQQ
jgi:hypothetical protein